MSRYFKGGKVTSQRGFSLLEAMIAVIVLATGLLALAALQGALARNSADARMRSQIAAAVEAIAEQQRNDSFDAIDSGTPDVSAYAVPGATGFSVVSVCTYTNVSDPSQNGACAGRGGATTSAQYKQLVYTATWNDATGQQRSMSLTSVLSPRTLSISTLPYSTATEGPKPMLPVVRTANPEVPGMIPIAIGDGSDTAATNPKPTIVSGNVIRTSYEVLTYQGSANDNIVKQQRRVETAVVGCTCASGAGPTGAQFERAQWPAYWDGSRYVIYQPSGSDQPAGTTVPSKGASVTQDLLCDECCRDHKDTASTEHVKFDPYRTDSHSHYRVSGADWVVAGAGEEYMEVCRMIRVDGFWRTAQDLDAKHFGLLQTQNNARSYLPLPAAVTNYETFVIDYLTKAYGPTPNSDDAPAIFDTKGLNAPASISINKPSPVDTRYLHSRGLYVDKVEPLARQKIDKALATGGCKNPDGSDRNKMECVLPLLAFTSINTTEASFWSPAVETNFSVDTDGFVVFDQDPPNRGRVNALASATVGSDSDVNVRMTKSNAGIAARARGIDPQDNFAATDAQSFKVLGSGATLGDSFNVVLAGLGTFNRSPAVGWSVTGVGENNCQGPAPYKCEVVGASLPQQVKITVAAYNRQEDERGGSTQVSCRKPDGTTFTGTYSPNGQNTIRWCRNYAVSNATTPTATGTISDPIRDGRVGNPSTGAGSEATEISFAGISSNQTVTLTFTLLQPSSPAPIDSCSFKQNGTLDGVVFKDCP